MYTSSRRFFVSLVLLLSFCVASSAQASGGSVFIQGVNPQGAIDPGTTVTFTASATGFTDPTYVIGDSTGGTTGTIDKIGFFSWTPKASDAGMHTVTVLVTDTLTHAASSTVNILVSAKSVVLSSLSPGTTTLTHQPLTFTLTAPGFISPSYGVYDTSAMTTLTPAAMSAAGAFAWTPTTDDVGVHALLVRAWDSYGHSAQMPLTITVKNPVATSTPAAVVAATVPAPTGTAPALIPTQTIVAPTSTSPSAYHFTTTLAVGSKGAAVMALQNRLTALNFYSGPVSGYYGVLTSAAVKKFQTARGIAPVGYVGPATRAALNK